MTLKRWIILVSISLVVSGCGIRERLFGGGQADRALPFRATVSAGDDRRDMTVRVVRAGGVSVSDVRGSARFAATRYCLTNFGGSDTLWDISPATNDWAFTRDGQDMLFQGRCVAR
ncbi:MAG: hypothetical protein AAGA06_07570 [Pseudomonadota bacterium]